MKELGAWFIGLGWWQFENWSLGNNSYIWNWIIKMPDFFPWVFEVDLQFWFDSMAAQPILGWHGTWAASLHHCGIGTKMQGAAIAVVHGIRQRTRPGAVANFQWRLGFGLGFGLGLASWETNLWTCFGWIWLGKFLNWPVEDFKWDV